MWLKKLLFFLAWFYNALNVRTLVHVWVPFVELTFGVRRDALLRFLLPAFDGGLPERVHTVFMSRPCSLFMAGVSLCMSERVRIAWLRERGGGL